VDDRNLGWLLFLTSVENTAFSAGDSALAVWRSVGVPPPGNVAAFQNGVTSIAYQQLLAWGPPRSPQMTLSYLANNQIQLSWSPIGADVFGRPVTVSAYTIYSSPEPFYHRLTGDSLTTVSGPPVILPAAANQQFLQVRCQP
jgi:hypothetical protein